MMNISTLVLYVLLLRIYPVKAIKDNNLVIRKSSYSKMTLNPMDGKNYDNSQARIANKDGKLRMEYSAEYNDAKRGEPKNNKGAKRHRKGELFYA